MNCRTIFGFLFNGHSGHKQWRCAMLRLILAAAAVAAQAAGGAK